MEHKECTSSNPEEAKTLDITLTLWLTGFTLDDGPLREFKDPYNREVFETLFKSGVPEELKHKAKRNEVFIQLVDRSEEEYCPLKDRTLRPFAGIRYKLRNHSPLESRLKAQLREEQKNNLYSKKSSSCEAFAGTGFRLENHSPLESRRKAQLREEQKNNLYAKKSSCEAFAGTGFRLENEKKEKVEKEKAKKEKPPAIKKPSKMSSNETGVKRTTFHLKKKEQDDTELENENEKKEKGEKEKAKKEKPPAIKKPSKMSSNETGVKRTTFHLKKKEQDDTELENEKQIIVYKNRERNFARASGKVKVEIHKENMKIAAIELKRQETALKMTKEKRRSAEIKLHDETKELNVREQINDLEESIKRR